MLGGNVFKVTDTIGMEEHRTPVLSMWISSAVSLEISTGIEFLSQHVEGIISTNRHGIEVANSAGLITIQHLFALDVRTIERGLKLIKRARPHCVEVLTVLTYPVLADRHPEMLDWPVLAGGLIKSPEEIKLVLEAGAVGVSTSYEDLCRGA